MDKQILLFGQALMQSADCIIFPVPTTLAAVLRLSTPVTKTPSARRLR
ncbi:hypothetical protein ACFLSH_01865 [Bacteroidota bacterium]